jgi:hypothetical protein
MNTKASSETPIRVDKISNETLRITIPYMGQFFIQSETTDYYSRNGILKIKSNDGKWILQNDGL